MWLYRAASSGAPSLTWLFLDSSIEHGPLGIWDLFMHVCGEKRLCHSGVNRRQGFNGASVYLFCAELFPPKLRCQAGCALKQSPLESGLGFGKSPSGCNKHRQSAFSAVVESACLGPGVRRKVVASLSNIWSIGQGMALSYNLGVSFLGGFSASISQALLEAGYGYGSKLDQKDMDRRI